MTVLMRLIVLMLVKGYFVYTNGGQRPLVVDNGEQHVIITDLKHLQNGTYLFQVSGFTSVGEGPLSDGVAVTLRHGGTFTIHLHSPLLQFNLLHLIVFGLTIYGCNAISCGLCQQVSRLLLDFY